MRRALIRNADLVMTLEPRLGDGELGLIPGGDVCREDNRITGVTVCENGTPRQETADYYVAAVPVEVMASLVTDALKQADPQLGRLASLRYSWMNGIQLYLKRDVPVVRGHSNYCDSPWALTSISQPQFWRETVGLVAWAAPLVGEQVQYGLGPAATSIAAIMGLTGAADLPVALTILVGTLLGASGAWLGSAGRALAPRGAKPDVGRSRASEPSLEPASEKAALR